MVQLLQLTAPNLAYSVLGGFAVLFSMCSLLMKEKLYISEVVLGTAFGIITGPYVTGIFNPRSWGTHHDLFTLEILRVVLATGLFAIGVELPGSYMAKHAKGLLVMIVPTMAIGWAVVAAIIHGLFPMFTMSSSLAIAACLTPTDPIISAAIVGGNFAIKHVPINIRHLVSAESAANDGLAYPFLTISIYLTLESPRSAVGQWFLIGWLYQVIMGTALGIGLGIVFSSLMKFGYHKCLIGRESYIAQYLALALLTIGIANILGTDDLLAAFAAGNAISWDEHFNTQTENETFASVLDFCLNCACFVYIGAWLPFESFNNPVVGLDLWRLIVLFIAVVFLRRIPCIMMLYKWIPEITNWKEALFTGHFGPMGVGAIFVSTLAVHKLPEPSYPPRNQQDLLAVTIQPIVSFVVLGSIIIHGLSIPFYSLGERIARRIASSRATTLSIDKQGISQTPGWLLPSHFPLHSLPPHRSNMTLVDPSSQVASTDEASHTKSVE